MFKLGYKKFSVISFGVNMFIVPLQLKVSFKYS
jgi:hypothetical protein